MHELTLPRASTPGAPAGLVHIRVEPVPAPRHWRRTTQTRRRCDRALASPREQDGRAVRAIFGQVDRAPWWNDRISARMGRQRGQEPLKREPARWAGRGPVRLPPEYRGARFSLPI